MLFESDIIAPGQYLANFRRGAVLEAEKSLMLAILEDAVLYYQKYHFAGAKKKRNLCREAEDWLMREGDDFFSFSNICEILGFDSQYIRRELIGWRRRKLKVRRRAEPPRRLRKGDKSND